MRVRFTVLGQAASKANRRRFARIGGRSLSVRSPEAIAFAQGMFRQIPTAARLMLAGDCAVRLRMFYRDNRSDLDAELVFDCLQPIYGRALVNGVSTRVLLQRGVILNDRQLKQKHIYHGIDPKNPRVEVTVWQLKPQAM